MEHEKFYTVRGYQLQEQSQKPLTASLEDYLEMIARSIRENGFIRVTELAAELNVKPSSVSKMIMKLAELGLLDYEKYGVIRLTEKGKETGDYLLWRHEVIRRFYELLSGHNDTSFVEAERTEHLLSEHTVRGMETVLRFFEAHEEAAAELRGRMERKEPPEGRKESMRDSFPAE